MAQAIAIGFTSLILTKMYNVSATRDPLEEWPAYRRVVFLLQELTEAMETLEPGDVRVCPWVHFASS